MTSKKASKMFEEKLSAALAHMKKNTKIRTTVWYEHRQSK